MWSVHTSHYYIAYDKYDRVCLAPHPVSHKPNILIAFDCDEFSYKFIFLFHVLSHNIVNPKHPLEILEMYK